MSSRGTDSWALRAAKPLLYPVRLLLRRKGDEQATINRLFISQHVRDIQVIVANAVLIFVPVLFTCFLVSILAVLAAGPAGWTYHFWFAGLGKLLPVFGPVLAVFGAVLTWAYQVGSARLGVVDLFACEITTLCRVAFVSDTVDRLIDMFNQGPPRTSAGAGGVPAVHQFNSQEDYFPVFEANARDLQTLEARVVIQITAFYTYIKAVRDSMRTLSEIGAQGAAWQMAAGDVIYRMFLGLESARFAITELDEFEPESAERRILILIGELQAYGFLCSHFDVSDRRYKRLDLRKADYEKLVPQLRRSVEKGLTDKSASHSARKIWKQASTLLDTLNKHFEEAMEAKPKALGASA
jgi:hypothetical protein